MNINVISIYHSTGYDTQKTYKIGEEQNFTDKALQKENEIKKDYDEIAFESFAPNAPDEVKTAWLEAAKETGVNGMGMLENGMLSHITQMTVQRAVKWYNGEPNSSDILGNSTETALRAARQALYDLENPLQPISNRRLEVQEQIMKEKEFYQAFIRNLEDSKISIGNE